MAGEMPSLRQAFNRSSPTTVFPPPVFIFIVMEGSVRRLCHKDEHRGWEDCCRTTSCVHLYCDGRLSATIVPLVEHFGLNVAQILVSRRFDGQETKYVFWMGRGIRSWPLNQFSKVNCHRMLQSSQLGCNFFI